jgi:hypothetical protein
VTGAADLLSVPAHPLVTVDAVRPRNPASGARVGLVLLSQQDVAELFTAAAVVRDD